MKRDESSLESVLEENELRARISAVLSSPEFVALPTVFLFIMALMIHAGAFYLSFIAIPFIPFSNYAFYAVAFVLHAFASFLLFTVAHECGHRSCFRITIFNDVLGTLAGSCMTPMAPYQGFRQMHNIHHKHTNLPDDPDLWSSHSEQFGLPRLVAWATLIFYYYYYFIFNMLLTRDHFLRPWRLLTSPDEWYIPISLAQMAFNGFLIYLAAVYSPSFWLPIVLYRWIAPSFLAFFILAFFFDYLPHAHSSSNAVENRYKSTSLIRLSKYLIPSSFISVLFQYLLVNQTYHVIHHLYPMVPYYNYRELWYLRKSYLLNNRQVETTVLFEMVDEVIELLPVLVNSMKEKRMEIWTRFDYEQQKKNLMNNISDRVPPNIKEFYLVLQPIVGLLLENLDPVSEEEEKQASAENNEKKEESKKEEIKEERMSEESKKDTEGNISSSSDE